MSLYPYQLQLSQRRRSVQLMVKDGIVCVKAPVGICQFWLEQWLGKKASWVQKQLQLSPHHQATPFLSRKTIMLAGQLVSLRYQIGASSKCWLNEEGLTIQLSRRVKAENQSNYAFRLFRQSLTQQAQSYFTAEVAALGQLMVVRPRSIVVGDWRSRWGFCNSRQEVGFNWRLMQAPDWVRRYVIVHELAHLTHMDHSRQFWQRVKIFYPDYVAAKQWLKHHQVQLLQTVA